MHFSFSKQVQGSYLEKDYEENDSNGNGLEDSRDESSMECSDYY